MHAPRRQPLCGPRSLLTVLGRRARRAIPRWQAFRLVWPLPGLPRLLPPPPPPFVVLASPPPLAPPSGPSALRPADHFRTRPSHRPGRPSQLEVCRGRHPAHHQRESSVQSCFSLSQHLTRICARVRPPLAVGHCEVGAHFSQQHVGSHLFLSMSCWMMWARQRPEQQCKQRSNFSADGEFRERDQNTG